MRRSLSLTLATLAVATVVLCGSVSSADISFPEMPGWTGEEEVLAFGPAELWEYINGAADAFLAYGFQQVRVRDISTDDMMVTVEIYDMGSDLNAFGIYRTELPRGFETLAVGAEGVVIPPYQCLLLKGSSYVKVAVLDGEITDASGKTLLEALAGALPGKDALPPAVTALPAAGRVTGSEGYARESFLGLSDLKNCVHATYRDDAGKEYKIFTMVPGDDGTADDLWNGIGDRWETVKSDGAPTVKLRSIPYSGVAGLVRTDTGVLGMAEIEDRETLLGRLRGLHP